MTFIQLNLHPAIIEAIKACGYTQTTPIQMQSVPVFADATISLPFKISGIDFILIGVGLG